MASGAKGWTLSSVKQLLEMSRLLPETSRDELWRGQLDQELTALEGLDGQLDALEKKLDAMAMEDSRCWRLMGIPGVGQRLSEAVVSIPDDPGRFKSGRQVGAYAGLAPRRYQSGNSDRQGRISRMGNPMLRSLLVEVAWVGLRYNPWMRQVYESARRGSVARKKTAIVAVARRLLVVCWAMLRDGATWRDPAARPPACG